MNEENAGLLSHLVSSGICKPANLTGNFEKVILLPSANESFNWLVGTYPILCSLAKQLRSDKDLQKIITDLNICFGFRKTDIPPTGLARQREYGNMQPRPAADFRKYRIAKEHTPAVHNTSSPHRLSDQFQNVEIFWATQSPQAHHIVEFNNLKKAGVSTANGNSDLDYLQLPCVLLMAEFHQRYVSSKLKDTHTWDDQPAELIKKLQAKYDKIYCTDAPKLASLGKISTAIFIMANKII